MRTPLLLALLTAAGAVAFLLLPPPAEKPAPPVPPPAESAPVAPVTPESLAAEVEAIRGLRFLTPLTFKRVPLAELEKIVRAAMSAAVPPADTALRLRAAFALGLIRAGMEFDAADCLAGSALEVPAAHYDAASATLFLNDAFSPETRPDLTARVVFYLALALLLQQPDIARTPLPAGNDDALLTRLALLDADATTTARRHTQRYAGRISSGVTVPEVFTYHASPPFLRSLLAFPGSAATLFHTPLHEKPPGTSPNDFLNQLLVRPPRTTAELLHPETFPAPVAQPIEFSRTAFPSLTALTENSLGEFGIRTLFKTQLTTTEAEPAAAGLLADRYLLFAGSGPGQDHLLWRTRWASAENAAAFLRALGATHLGNTGTAPAPEHFPAPGTFRATTPARIFAAVTGPGHTVTFAASPDPAFVSLLMAAP